MFTTMSRDEFEMETRRPFNVSLYHLPLSAGQRTEGPLTDFAGPVARKLPWTDYYCGNIRQLEFGVRVEHYPDESLREIVRIWTV